MGKWTPRLDTPPKLDGTDSHLSFGWAHGDERDHHIIDAGAKQPGQQQRQQQARKGQREIRRPPQQAIGRAAKIAADESGADAKQRLSRHHQHHHFERHPRAGQQAIEQRPAEFVAAQPRAGRQSGRRQDAFQMHRIRCQRQPRRQHRQRQPQAEYGHGALHGRRTRGSIQP